MSKKTISKPLTIAMGAALVGGLAAMGSVSADVTVEADPFAMEELSSGYRVSFRSYFRPKEAIRGAVELPLADRSRMS